jgi:hypothetical protein
MQDLVGTPFTNTDVRRVGQLTHDLTRDNFRDRIRARTLFVVEAARYGHEGEKYPVPREDIEIFSDAIANRFDKHRRRSRQIAADALRSTFDFIASLARIRFPIPEFDIPQLGDLAIADSAFVDVRHRLLSGVEDSPT